MEAGQQMDKESVYGKAPPNLFLQIAKKAYKWLESLAEGAHSYAAMLGLVVMLMLGLASASGVPVYLRAGEQEPTKLLFSPTMGWIMVVVGLLGMLGVVFNFTKSTMGMIKKRREARKVKNHGLPKLY